VIVTITAALKQKRLAGLCLFILCAIVISGLWSFNFYVKNEVTWIPNENGLLFGDIGSIYSFDSLPANDPGEIASGAIELLMTGVAATDTNTIFALSSRENPVQFSVRQSNYDLLVQDVISNHQTPGNTSSAIIPNAFPEGKQTLYTFTFGSNGLVIYMNGQPAGRFPKFIVPSNDFSGQIVIGTSPVYFATWAGKLSGVAVYDHELVPDQVLLNYAIWNSSGQRDVFQKEGAIALYLFTERTGNMVHSTVNTGPNLYIPKRFTIPRKPFLQSPWEAYYPGWSYVQDVSLNIIGFIPFGLSFYMYFLVRQIKRPALMTVLLGGAVSLTIEALQKYLPMRDSDMTDFLNNTFGTALGVILSRWKPVRYLLAKCGLPS